MEEGIKVCGPGVPYKEIGRAIEFVPTFFVCRGRTSDDLVGSFPTETLRTRKAFW
jgi:hypothetical protein